MSELKANGTRLIRPVNCPGGCSTFSNLPRLASRRGKNQRQAQADGWLFAPETSSTDKTIGSEIRNKLTNIKSRGRHPHDTSTVIRSRAAFQKIDSSSK